MIEAVPDLATEERERFLLDGYVIMTNLFDSESLSRAQEEIYRYMPSWEEYSAAPEKFPALDAAGSTAGSARASFPFAGRVINNAFAHPRLLNVIEYVMGTDRVSLEHSGLTGKYAGIRDYDQELHVDYGNHTLAYPKDPAKNGLDYDFGCIVYYTDVTIDLGPTYVVSQTVTKDEVLVPRHRSRSEFGWMYEHEVAATVPAGSAVLYSIRTFHRGSAMTACEGARFSQHLGYRVAPEPYYDPRHFMRAGGSKEMDRFLIQATPKQRAMVGFPPVGDPYWDSEMLDGVRRRYPAMDMSPYEGG
jgi:ectoine hydroxylase-related dioxygenase (phytanoyl-CoA dioxygenase family)